MKICLNIILARAVIRDESPPPPKRQLWQRSTVYPKKYAHGFCFAVLCCGYTLTDFPISIRLTSLALWQSNDCPSASKATLMNMDKRFMWINYERLHNHNKAKHNKTVCIFLGIYCIFSGDCKTYTRDTPQFACEGKVWSVCCQFTIRVLHIDGLVQDCRNYSALAMELLQSCTKPWFSSRLQ